MNDIGSWCGKIIYITALNMNHHTTTKLEHSMWHVHVLMFHSMPLAISHKHTKKAHTYTIRPYSFVPFEYCISANRERLRFDDMERVHMRTNVAQIHTHTHASPLSHGIFGHTSEWGCESARSESLPVYWVNVIMLLRYICLFCVRTDHWIPFMMLV